MDRKAFEVLNALETKDQEQRRQEIPRHERLLALHPDSARLLHIMARTAKARNIVEVGTGHGYSTIWLAMAAQANGGRVVTCEYDETRAAEARANLEQAGLKALVDIRVGDARETLRALTGEVDLLFIDAVKEHYETYFDIVYPRLVAGGLVVADNLLSHEDELADYRSYVENYPNLESVLVPIGRGLEVSVKLEA